MLLSAPALSPEHGAGARSGWEELPLSWVTKAGTESAGQSSELCPGVPHAETRGEAGVSGCRGDPGAGQRRAQGEGGSWAWRWSGRGLAGVSLPGDRKHSLIFCSPTFSELLLAVASAQETALGQGSTAALPSHSGHGAALALQWPPIQAVHSPGDQQLGPLPQGQARAESRVSADMREEKGGDRNQREEGPVLF